MKVLPFKLPKTEDASFRVQVDHQPHFYDTFHQHPEIQITLIIESTGTVILGDYVGSFRPGDVFVIGANIPHVLKNDADYYNENSTLKAHAISVFFDQSTFGSEFLQLPETRELRNFLLLTKRGLKLKGSLKKVIGNMMRNIEFLHSLDKLIHLLKLINILVRSDKFIPMASETMNFSVTDMEGKRLNDIYQFTMNEYDRPISLEEVAEIASMTPSAFCRYFKQRTRKTYIDFLTEVRIGHACKLLISKDTTVTEVCYKAGFNNLSNFNRKFKKLTGYTPTHYQKVHR